MPIARNASIITSVSSLRRAPVNVDRPSANAAQIKARLVRLLLPGGRTVPSTRPPGTISTKGEPVSSIKSA